MCFEFQNVFAVYCQVDLNISAKSKNTISWISDDLCSMSVVY